jgi:hypothetical protein
MNSFFHNTIILTEKLTFGKKKEKRGNAPSLMDVGADACIRPKRGNGLGIDPYKGVGYGKK